MSSNSIVILKRIDHDPETMRPIESIDSILSFDSEQDALRWALEITEAQEWASCIVSTVGKPPEIFWQKYRHLKRVALILQNGNAHIGLPDHWPDHVKAQHYWDFAHPYVCVIHEPSKRGYYLNRNYQFICNVMSIVRPGDPSNEDYIPATLKSVVEHETELNHQAASFTTPKWAEELPPTEFSTYWLY